MTRIIDPPSGWRYGFPKEYNPKPDQTLRDWLLEQGYPEELLELAEKYSRFWEQQNG